MSRGAVFCLAWNKPSLTTFTLRGDTDAHELSNHVFT
jgi:hypothetical protein